MQLISRTYRLMCTSKATPVSRSRGWCSMRTIVSMKVTLIRRRTANTDEMRDMQRFISTDLSNHLFLAVCVQAGFFVVTVGKRWCLHVDAVTSLQSEDTRCSDSPVSMVCANISSPSSWAGGSSDASGGSFRHSWASCMLEVMLDDQPWESQPPPECKQNHMGYGDYCTLELLCTWFIIEDSTLLY